MARHYIPATVPMEFVKDLKTSEDDEDDGVTQCCQYPMAARHRRQQQFRDNSTIIEFVHVPTEGYGHSDTVASQEMFRKHPENVKNNKGPRNSNTSYEVTVSPLNADNVFYQRKSNHMPPLSSSYNNNHSNIQPRNHDPKPFLYHHHDPDVNFLPQPSKADESLFNISNDLDFDLNHSSSSNNDSLPRRNCSLSSHSPISMPSEEISLSTINSTGFKYKTQLLSRYSSQLEEENRMLKELLRNA